MFFFKKDCFFADLKLWVLNFLWVQENIPLEEVFENLRCSKEGLTSDAAQERLAIFGPNKLEEKKVRFLVLGYFIF